VSARQSFAWAFGVSALYLAFGIAAYVFLLGRIEPSAGQCSILIGCDSGSICSGR